jgi:hypothetical protein
MQVLQGLKAGDRTGQMCAPVGTNRSRTDILCPVVEELHSSVGMKLEKTDIGQFQRVSDL